MQFEQAIGLLGGTFDPIHDGHLRMAVELAAHFKLAKMHLIPCYQPVHRAMPKASAEARLAMVEAAIQGENELVLDAREINRKGPSYMIDTILEWRAEKPNTPLCLCLGFDAFLGFAQWERGEEILQHAHLIVAHRPHYDLPHEGEVKLLLDQHLQTDPNYIHTHLAGGIMLQAITALHISASEIRKQIAMGGNPRYLLPDAVNDYIKKNHLYLTKP